MATEKLESKIQNLLDSVTDERYTPSEEDMEGLSDDVKNDLIYKLNKMAQKEKDEINSMLVNGWNEILTSNAFIDALFANDYFLNKLKAIIKGG